MYVEGRPVIGGVHSVTSDSLRLTLWEQPGSALVPLATLGGLEVSRGRESRWSSAVRWGWRSALVFAGLTAVMLAPLCGSGEEVDCGNMGVAVAQTAIAGGLYGGIYGSFAPRERWVRVPVPGRDTRP